MGLHHSFELRCLFTLKIGLTLANSDRTTCTNMFSSNSDGWRLAACLSLKNQRIPQTGPLVTRDTTKRKNPLKCLKVHILTAVFNPVIVF